MIGVKMVAKAVTAGVVAFAGSLTAAADGGVTAQEWLTSVVAAVTAGLAVWAVPNKGA